MWSRPSTNCNWQIGWLTVQLPTRDGRYVPYSILKTAICRVCHVFYQRILMDSWEFFVMSGPGQRPVAHQFGRIVQWGSQCYVWRRARYDAHTATDWNTWGDQHRARFIDSTLCHVLSRHLLSFSAPELLTHLPQSARVLTIVIQTRCFARIFYMLPRCRGLLLHLPRL